MCLGMTMTPWMGQVRCWAQCCSWGVGGGTANPGRGTQLCWGGKGAGLLAAGAGQLLHPPPPPMHLEALATTLCSLAGVRDYIHIVDLAKGHIAALKKLKENCGCKVGNGALRSCCGIGLGCLCRCSLHLGATTWMWCHGAPTPDTCLSA